MKGLMFCMARTYCTVGALLAVALGCVLPWVTVGLVSGVAASDVDMLAIVGGASIPVTGILAIIVVCATMYRHMHDGVFSMIVLTETPLYRYVLAQSLLPMSSVVVSTLVWMAVLAAQHSSISLALGLNIVILGAVINVLVISICLLWYQLSPNLNEQTAAMGSVFISVMVIWLSLWTELQSLGTINGLVTILGLIALAVGVTVWCEHVFRRRFPRTLTHFLNRISR